MNRFTKAAVIAVAAGVRAASWSTAVPTPIREVRAAIQAATETASEPQASETQTES